MLVLELLEMFLLMQVDAEDSEDQSLIELAGEMLEESLDIDEPERLHFSDSVLFLEIFDGVRTAEPDAGGLVMPASTFLFMEFKGDLLVLPDEFLPKEVGADFVLVATDGAEDDLFVIVVLGTIPPEPLIVGAFGTEHTLPERTN